MALTLPLLATFSITFSIAAAADPVTSLPPLPVTVRAGLENPSTLIPVDFTGLSFETSLLLPDAEGRHYFAPDNKALLNLFHTLGIRSLRIGGNTGDRDLRKAPSEADIDSLFAFAKESGVKVIYCLRLYNGNPQEDAHVAKYITDHYASLVESFSIGQEPSAYPVEKIDTRRSDERMGAGHTHYSYESFATNWSRFSEAILASVPEAKFSGPGADLDPEWPRHFMADFGKTGHIVLLTAHIYPGGAGGKVPVPEVGRDKMLSCEFEPIYEKLDAGLLSASEGTIPFRLEEANNFFNGGTKDASNTHTAALWGLDFMWWWVSHGAAGVNFHTGNQVAAGDKLVPCKYTAFYSTKEGCTVQPLGYGMKAFSLGTSGHIVPLTLSPSDPGLRAYASTEKGTLCLTLINRTYGAIARTFELALDIPQPSGSVETLTLSAPQGDISAKTGITLGGASILPDGSWKGAWTPLNPSATGKYTFPLPSATAVIIRVPIAPSSH